MARSRPLVTVPDDVLVLTGQGIPRGKIAFMSGPATVWYGDVSSLPDQIDGVYNVISIHAEDYGQLFLPPGVERPSQRLTPADFPPATMDSAEEINAADRRERAEAQERAEAAIAELARRRSEEAEKAPSG